MSRINFNQRLAEMNVELQEAYTRLKSMTPQQIEQLRIQRQAARPTEATDSEVPSFKNEQVPV